MNKQETFDKAQARAYCMEYGAIAGLIFSGSFLCAMFGYGSVLLAQCGNILALVGVFVAGRLIRTFNREVSPLNFRRACYMAMLTYLFAILLTALVQYIYFSYFDNGRLMMQMEQILSIPEYKNWLSQVAEGGDVDSLLDGAMKVFRNPISLTLQLMWLNCLLSLFAIIPTALIGVRK